MYHSLAYLANGDVADLGENAGGNSVQEFNMGKKRGSFVLKYDTGDQIADIVRVYDCIKSEISPSKIIWQINEASDGLKSVDIPFNNSIITVEVIGGGNIDSIWEYFVECPN